MMIKYEFRGDMTITPKKHVCLSNRSEQHSLEVFEFVDLSFLTDDQEVLLRGIGHSDSLLSHQSTILLDVLKSDYTEAISWEGFLWVNDGGLGDQNVISRALSCRESSCIVVYQKENQKWFKILLVENLTSLQPKVIQTQTVNTSNAGTSGTTLASVVGR